MHHGKTIDGRRFTVVGLYSKEDQEICFGVAICGPRDHFAKKVGRSIAEGRAIKNPTLVKEMKTEIPENKEGYKKIGILGHEILKTVMEDPYIYQEILTEQYRKHKKNQLKKDNNANIKENS